VAEGVRARGLSDFVKIDVGIVRGLAYYTGIVFEVFDRAGKLRALAGGGRYDGLIAQLSDGASKMSALGFAMGDVVLGELIRDHELARAQMENEIAANRNIEIYVIVAKEERRGDALTKLQELRHLGYRVDYPFAPAKVGKQFQTAEELGAQIVLVFGDEWPQVAVKSLGTGEQRLLSSEHLAVHIQNLLTLDR
jgi:histidyl-tRNA synthetase